MEKPVDHTSTVVVVRGLESFGTSGENKIAAERVKCEAINNPTLLCVAFTSFPPFLFIFVFCSRQASVKALLGRFHYFLQGNCVVHHMFGDDVSPSCVGLSDIIFPRTVLRRSCLGVSSVSSMRSNRISHLRGAVCISGRAWRHIFVCRCDCRRFAQPGMCVFSPRVESFHRYIRIFLSCQHCLCHLFVSFSLVG